MRLVVFDCDGTLVDSQATIATAMTRAFEQCRMTPPSRERSLSVVGLSLPNAMAALVPDIAADDCGRLVEAYRAEAQRLRLEMAEDPLYDGADAAVRALAARDDHQLGIATGKSLRGVQRLVGHYSWEGFFATVQTADTNPSKPSPVMLERAMAEAGASPAETIMVGDTTYDMAMARQAGVAALGVSWGYHERAALQRAGAQIIIDDFAALIPALDRLLP